MEGRGKKKFEPVPVLSHQELSMSMLSVLVHAGEYVNVCVCVYICTPDIKQLFFLNIHLPASEGGGKS